jgi:O-acetyl-ADP-ribose deacetylase (regulator of RNase III)
MKIILTDLNPLLIKAWKSIFADQKDVSIIHGDLTKLTCDAVVSPANSFGFMDGGIDYALSERFGWNLQERLQEQIKELPEGELLVGQALVLETGDSKVPFLISAPTMRVPMDFNIHSSLNAYLAMKAILIKAKAHPRIVSIVVPGLCTGSGRMPPAIAARQMRVAYNEIILGMKMDFDSFAEVQDYHLHINPAGKIFE